jgi:hypothetical protein
MYLVGKGVPWEVAHSLYDHELLGLTVIAGENDGGKFNWDRMEFERD